MADPTANGEEPTNPTPEKDIPDVVQKPRRARTSTRPKTRKPADSAGPEQAPAAADGGVQKIRTVEVARGTAADIDGEVLMVQQGGINEANARQIDVRQGGIGRARADDIAVSQGGIVVARGEHVSVELGGVGLAVAGDVRVTQGMAGTVLARDVHIEQGAARTVIASRAVLERNVGVFMLIAGRVEGNVRTILDWRGAIAFGAAFGLVAGLIRRRRS